MANTKKVVDNNIKESGENKTPLKISDVKVGDTIYDNKGVALNILKIDDKFGGRVLIESGEYIGEPKWKPIKKFTLEKVEYKTGGKVKKKKTLLKPHKPTDGDLARKSKTTGYRFKTSHLKKKDGTETKLAKKLHFKKPTSAEVEKYKKNPDGSYPNKVKEVYHERRQDRKHSDDSPNKKFEDGGDVDPESEHSSIRDKNPKVDPKAEAPTVASLQGKDEHVGWLTKLQVETKIGRKLRWWGDSMISINGKVYEKCWIFPYYKPVKVDECEPKIESTPVPEPTPTPAPSIAAAEPTPIPNNDNPVTPSV